MLHGDDCRIRRAWAQYMAFASWLLDVFAIDAYKAARSVVLYHVRS